MIDIKQFDEFIVKPTLEYLGATTLKYKKMNSLAARQLLIGTALTESGLKYVKQIGGSAVSFFQIEPVTYQDNYDNYLKFHPFLNNRVKKLSAPMPCGKNQMLGNMYYATAHARLKYWRDKRPLPEAGDYKAMADYHKKIYNSYLGATDIEKSVEFFKQAVERII